MTEAEQITNEPAEPTIEEFAAEVQAEAEVEADQSETPEEQPAESETEQEQTFEVQGEQVPISELIGGYMKGADYTQKTQEAARKMEEAEAIKAAVDRFYETPGSPEWEPAPPQKLPSGEPTGLPEFASETEQRLWNEQQQLKRTTVELLANQNRNEIQREVRRIEGVFDNFVAANSDMPEAKIVEISQTVRGRNMPYTKESFDLVSRAVASQSPDDIGKAAVAEYIEQQKALKNKGEMAALEPGSAPAHSEPPPDINSLSEAEQDRLMAAEFKRQEMGG